MDSTGKHDVIGGDMVPCRFPPFSRAVADANTNGVGRQMAAARVVISEQQAEKLHSMVADHSNGDSLGTLLRATWALVLGCYTGQDDVCFGFHPGGDDPCNVLVARFTLDNTTTTSEILDRAKTGPNPGNQASFDTAVIVWGGRDPEVANFNSLNRLNFLLLVTCTDETITLSVEWKTDYLGMPMAQGKLVADTTACILSALLEGPNDICIRDLALVGGANADQVLTWNESISTEPVERCIHQVIADRVHDQPDAEAVCAWDGSMTYRDLDMATEVLAARLVQLGVGPEVLVPLCFEKSKFTIVAMVAVLKAGGAFVPLDPNHPVERLRGLCTSVNASLIVCSPKYRDIATQVVSNVLAVDDATLKHSVTFAVDKPTVAPTNAAYVIFTSGSTGKPKGTVIEHRAFCSSARAHAPALLISGDCRVLQFAAHTFDASLVEMLTPLMVGGCVCIPSDQERLDDLAGAINRMGVNHAVLTPSFVGFLSPAAVPGLRRLVLAGEAMTKSHIATWSHIELVNGYGPAESSVAAVCNSRMRPDTEPTDIGVPCGVRVWLVDPLDHNRLVPVGCVGEMLLEGPSLARGYLNDSAKTEESFVFDPAWAGKTAQGQKRRFYKTGDLARYNSVIGSLTYVGRKDTQVKLHGQRIELGEIEHHLAVDESARHGVVLLPKSGQLKGRIVAVVSLPGSLESEEAIAETLKLVNQTEPVKRTLKAIRARLEDRLPGYMVPTVWLCIETMPVLASRKMNRKAVTTWVESVITAEQCQDLLTDVKGTSSEEKPLTPTEATLRDIWSIVLNLPAERISPDSHTFLGLGGDSITAMTCASRAKKVHLDLKVQDVLRAKSLRQLARSAKTMSVSGTAHDDASDKEQYLDKPFELSPIQKLHFQARGAAEGDEHFNQSFCLRMARHVDEKAICKAIEVLVERHEMLRARFVRTDSGDWQQLITADVASSYRFRAHSMSGSSPDTDDNATVDAGIASAQGCLSVTRGPVFAAELFQGLASGQPILFMTAHHLVVDLVSWRVILDEMEEILQNFSASVNLPAPLSFRKWVALQKEDCLRSCIAVGPDQTPVVDFAFWDMEQQPNLYGDVVCEGFEVDEATTTALLSDCHKPLRTETVDLLLAALGRSFLNTFPERTPPAMFNEGHGREPPSSEIDVSHTVGWFTTLFPVAVASSATLVDALAQIKDARKRVPGNGRPYFAAQFYSPSGRVNSAMEIAFNFLGRYQQLERAGALFQPASLLAGEAHQGSPTADFGRAAHRFALFEISAVIVGGLLRFSFAWNKSMRHQERIRDWVTACRQTLTHAATSLPHLDRMVTTSDLPLLLPTLTPDDLSDFGHKVLPDLVSDRRKGWAAIEDVYPASPIQQGLLMSRSKNGEFYAVRRAFRVSSRGGVVVDAARLARAWRHVVQHHALLRTVFVEAISRAAGGGFDQVVLADADPAIELHHGKGDIGELIRTTMEPMQYTQYRPQHRLSIFNADHVVAGVLEISHAIMDGASMDILLRDLGRGYDDMLEHVPRPLFSPFVASLQQRNIQEDIAFWAGYLAGMEPCHFPVLNDGVAVPESDRELRSLRVAVPDLKDLKNFCDAKGLTLPNVFTAAWAVVLSCYTGTDDVCFGYLASGRDAALLEGSEDAVGPFINMATQRVRITDTSTSLLQLVEAVQSDQLRCMPYAQTSLAEIQHALKTTPGGMALFNTCISYRRRLSSDPITTTSLVFEDLEAIHDPTEYPISLNIETSDAGELEAFIDLDFWTDSLSSPQASHIASAFVHALSNIHTHPTTPVSQLDHAPSPAKSLIYSWNATLPAPTRECLHRMVDRQVSLRPQAQAIHAWDRTFSYREMNTLADRLALHLSELGVAPEVLVPVCFDKSAWTVIAMLAVLKAGGGVVPLDASHPVGALEGKVRDCEARIVVASESRAGLFGGMVSTVVAVGDGLLSRLGKSQEVESGVTPDSPAFVMFTSGSTGKPKGVVLCHQALVSSCLAHGKALGVGPDTRFLQFAAHTFDNSIEEMFTTLTHGGCVCVPSEEDRLGDLPGAINRLGANFMDLTPTVAVLLHPSQVPTIKGMAVGGEALTQAVLDAWGGAVPVHNQYGPSECSINAAHRLHTGADGDISNIGTSVGSVSWVVDPQNHDRLSPIGCVGELLIEGPILARGYLNRPDVTAKSFIEMPKWAIQDPRHGERGSRRMYKTGDLVRYNSDGSLIYLGRKDTQVKLHGQRIELGEIEHHVKSSLPPAAQSAVELVPLEGLHKALAAFVALSPLEDHGDTHIMSTSPEFTSVAQTTAAALSANVAAYMIPTLFFPVSRMPLTSSGKLDRRALRTLAQNLSGEVVTEYRLGARIATGRAPETALEKELQQLWSTVLKVDCESISADDSFFRHGGDSIGAMRLAAAARQRSLVLTVANIFQSPKLSDMATTVEATEGCAAAEDETVRGPTEPFSLLKEPASSDLQRLKQQAASICRADGNNIEDIYPCTPLQEGLIAASQRQPGAYVAVNSYELPSGTDLARFKAAWKDVLLSEAILRTRVAFFEGIGFLQVVLREIPEWISIPEFTTVPESYTRLPQHDGGPLSQYILSGENTSRPVFTWVAHHALYDGWSLPTLLSRVSSRYHHPFTPAPSVPHYSRFVEYLSSLNPSSSDHFWATHLSTTLSSPSHFPTLPHPAYHPKTTSQSHRSFSFSRPRQSDLTTASFLRIAFALTLSAHASSDDIIFCEVLSGRDVPLPQIESLVGPTLCSIPRRVRFDRSLSVQRTLGELHGQFGEVISHQFAGLQRIRGLSQVGELGSLFAIEAGDAEEDEGEGLWGRLVAGGGKQSGEFFNYPLNVTCSVTSASRGAGAGAGLGAGEEVRVCAWFDEGVVAGWLVERMLGQFEAVLQRIGSAAAQGERVGDVGLCSAEDEMAIRGWNETPGPVVHDLIHEMISSQMASGRTEATAVVGWDVTLTNGELESLSSRLAQHLVGKGVSRGTFVPFCFDKSTFAIVAMLAILKAGAAFVPLDPSHPPSRLAEIVGDCKASVILCSTNYEQSCSGLVPTVVNVDMGSLQGLKVEPTPELPACTPDDPAYVIFTSGTTGKPKGTIISHSAFCSGAAAHGPAMQMHPPFRFLQFASYTFDASLVEILTTLLMGGTICVPREEDRTNGNLASFMERTGVTMTLLTPSFAKTLHPSAVPSLKTLILGGEAMSRSHLDTWSDKLTLINAYGPSECAVVATAKAGMHSACDPANLGRAIGRCWIADPQNHDRLAPVGAIGELLIEGPSLSVGYLNNEAKTREVFVENPKWASESGVFRFPDLDFSGPRPQPQPQPQPRRMYKTGDLVRIADDVSGEMIYVGRKDSSQAKVNGQRLEMDEIAHHLEGDEAVRHVVVVFPKAGPCAKRLVAAVVLARSVERSVPVPGSELKLVASSALPAMLDAVQERLGERVPGYMIPSHWVVLADIPLLPSGKLNRRAVADFVESMTDETLEVVTSQVSHRENGSDETSNVSVDEKLRLIWSEVLNVPLSRVGKNVSFLHLGGDSINAMQVMARCRSQGMQVAVRDIIDSKSVHHLALQVASHTDRPLSVPDEDHHEFDLSPIQQLFFGTMQKTPGSSSSHFNQSVLLRLHKDITPDKFARGLHALVETHSMLRARFRRDGAGTWRQRITTDTASSYRYRTYTVSNQNRMEKRIQASQRSLDVQKGPVVVADAFTVVSNENSETFVFVAVHHLVVDVVSWGILLQDLEDFFAVGTLRASPSMSFQAWTRTQSQRAQDEENGAKLLPHREASEIDLDYWGMSGVANVHGDVITTEVELDGETTALLLDSGVLTTLKAEALDVLLATFLLSIRQAWPGRGTPTVYNEGHGREPWDGKVDLSRTVGWFTTLYPVHLPLESSSDDNILNAIRWVRDYRSRLPGKGRPYFAYRLLTSHGREEYGQPGPVEVSFNYLGQMQGLSRTDTFLQPVDGTHAAFDIAPDVPRFSLIEVSARVTDGKMGISLAYNKHMDHQESLQSWAGEYAQLLQQASKELRGSARDTYTLGQFPLLPLTYYGIDSLSRRLQEMRVDHDNIEDVYPCSPMQRGLLLSQLRDAEKYAYRAVFQLDSARGEVDLERLCSAWQDVIKRHATLRTVFIETVGDEGLMNQLVLRNVPGRIQLLQSETYDGALETLGKLSPIDYREKKPPHRLSICKSSTGHVFCQLEISHAISDGSSMPILLDDLSRVYGGTITELPPALYRDYAAYMQSQPRSESVRYWRQYLAGAEPCLFPSLTDGETDIEPSLASHMMHIPDFDRVNTYCATSGITLSTFFQLVWGLVLRSYTGSDSILFGYLASGRDVPISGIESAVGAFINMLVCRLDLPREAELCDLLEIIKNDLAGAMAHQACSLAEMQHELQLQLQPPSPAASTTASTGNLFNTAFTYQRRSSRSNSAPSSSKGALHYRVITASDPSEYAIAVNVEASDASVEIHFGYWRNLVSDAQMQNIAAAFAQAVKDVVGDVRDDRTVGEVDLLGGVGVGKLVGWNGRDEGAVERCVHELVGDKVREHPDKMAVCGWDASFSYQELERVTEVLARHLVAVGGVRADMLVPLCFEKSAWAVVAQLAVLKAGGAFVSLDPDHPESRLRELVEDVGAKLVISSPKHSARMEKIADQVVVVDQDSIRALEDASYPPLATKTSPGDAAYVIFTSGTTGKPKGTVIEHAAFCTGGLAHAKAMFMNASSRVLQFASYTFDASVMETLSCLLVGGCVCVPSDQEKMNDLAKVINDMDVTWTLLTPSVASTLKPESVPGLKTLVTGGEAMSAGHIARWGTQCALVNAYGPTECSVVATTSTKVDESHRLCNSDCSNIGTAVGGRIWVVDAQNPDSLVPIGAVGELVVEGRHVARGYLNRPEQTAKVFIHEPAWTRHEAFPPNMFARRDKMYRTGDLVRYNSDGSVSYISRKDTQVKVNGRRIELGEVEFHCRASLPEDFQIAVDVVAPNGGAKTLAVFFVPAKTGQDFSLLPMDDSLVETARAIEAYVVDHLPTYMIPQMFIPVSAMPWTTAGKLDRRQLRQAVEGATREMHLSYKLSAAPAAKSQVLTSGAEKALRDLWAAILNIAPETITAGDNFFRLGGDSLTAMKLVGAARAQRMTLSVLDMFENPTLTEMAKCVTLEASGAVEESNPDLFQLVRGVNVESLQQEVANQCQIAPENICDIYPCSPLQEALFALANKQAGAYVAVSTMRFPRSIDLDRFKAAWQMVADHTDTLRTRVLHTPESGFLQVVTAPEPMCWHEDTLESAKEKSRILGSQNGGELTRYTIVRDESGQPSCFVWGIHHAVYDGWSLPRLVQRVQEIYDNGSEGEFPAHSYASFIRYLQGRNQFESEQFWKTSLQGTSATHFPQLPTSAKTPHFQHKTCEVDVDRSNLVADVTIPTLIRAAWSILVAAYTGTDDVIFGETLSGRNIDVAGIEDIAGPTFTTVPTRIQVRRDMAVADFLIAIHRMSSRVAPHQHLGLQRIKQLSDDCAGACGFQNIVTIQMSHYDKDDDWQFEGGASTESFFTHPLVLDCTVVDNTIHATMHHNDQILSSWQAERLSDQLQAILTQLVRSTKNTFVRDIHAISPSDYSLIRSWNSHFDATKNTMHATIHSLFLQQAKADPQRLAITGWDGSLTYHQVLDYASRLAAHLSTLGVGRGTLVPVCLTRDIFTPVTLLAVLMSGGAFVPLDGSHPLSRQMEMLSTTGASLLVCSPEHTSRFASTIPTCVTISREIYTSLPAPPPSPAADVHVQPSDLAYILFTSGSTGAPKGVACTHLAFLSSSAGFTASTNMTSSSRVLHFASLAFDVALMEVLSPLTLGGSVCVPRDADRLSDIQNATWAFLTPSVANILDVNCAGSLETLVCGGEAMVSDTVAKWAGRVRLMNGYGPTEACVLAVINDRVEGEGDRAVIGRAHGGGCAWVVTDSENREMWLAPVGAVGELAISGPLLAEGYFGDGEKTGKVFVESPAWAGVEAMGGDGPRRIYRTGDLVRYRSDGAIEFLGRRDGQVKVNGQRIELGEIESRLSADERVQLGLVTQPKAGPCGKQLVAVLSLAVGAAGSVSADTSGCKVVDGSPEWMDKCRAEIAAIRSHLADSMPHYMVPTVWIALERMPVVVSGKLDRVKVTKWVAGLSDEEYETISQQFSPDEAEEMDMTEGAATLREIWAEELRIPVDRVKVNQGFLSIGGDSIRAMGIVSRARRAGLGISVRDVLAAKSVVHLAQLAKPLDAPISNQAIEADNEDAFSLSPIQNMYFHLSDQFVGTARFNQSSTFSLPRDITVADLKKFIDTLVVRHGMLRARYLLENGQWVQRIIKEPAYGFFTHRAESEAEIAKTVAHAQQSLSIQDGPVFRVDVFEGDRTTVSMVAHHLVIDMVSWRIILSDLTRLLEKVSLDEKPMSFKAWCSLQSKWAKSLQMRSLPFKETQPDLAYWGIEQPPVYGRTDIKTFALDESTTKLALTDCHRAFNSEPLDLFLAAIAHAFNQTFKDRAPPTLYNESHGRETPDGLSVDLSQTVGWFTSICPLVVPATDDPLDTVRRTKDVRRSVPNNGWTYFAKKFLSNNKQSPLMEILFNYLGEGVQQEQTGIIQPVELDDTVSDVGPDTRRLALFEVSAIVTNNQLRFTFIYDNTLARIGEVSSWVESCKQTLEDMVRSLHRRLPEPTLSDYPLMSMTYEDLAKLVDNTLSNLGVGVSDVEDIYPCTPVQEGMLISQFREPEAYVYHGIYDVHNRGSSAPPDESKLARAWQKVVDRHAALRTIFTEIIYRDGIFGQIVLKKGDCAITTIQCSDDEALTKIEETSMQATNTRLPHHLTICTTESGRMMMKLEANHAAMDGGSLGIIIGELADAYNGTLEGDGPLYSDYIRYIRNLPTDEDTKYWMHYLNGIRPCYFPKLAPETETQHELRSLQFRFPRFPELRRAAEKANITLANTMHAAWALVLRKYTASDDVCFGYLVADRDAPVPNIHRTVGTLINMLCCRVQTNTTQSLESLLHDTHDQHLQSMQYQRCSLALVQHHLGLAGKPLYNTSISTQNTRGEPPSEEEEGVLFELQQGYDPSEYAITLNIDTVPGDEGIVFRYWSDHITDNQIREISDLMTEILERLITRADEPIDGWEAAEKNALPKRADTDLTLVDRENLGQDKFAPMSLTIPEDGYQHDHARILADLWRKLLNLPSDFPLTAEDSFFDLGGDSIIAMKLVGDARDQGLSLTVADVFQHPRLEDMVDNAQFSGTPTTDKSSHSGNDSTLQGAMTRSASSESVYERFSLLAASNVGAYLQTNIVPQVGVFRGGIADVLPATDFQSLAVTGALLRSRWMLNCFCLDGQGSLDVGRLRRACFRLVQSLDILRTVFVPSGGRFLQVVLRALKPAFHVVDIDDTVSLKDYSTNMLQTKPPPQLGEPLVEFTVIRHQSQHHRILIRLSHAQYDGVCFPLILRALQAAYQGESIPPTPTFANYLRASAGSLETAHYTHWKRLLSGSSMTCITRRDRPDYHLSASGGTTILRKTVILPPVESGHITTATVVKAAWAYVLAQTAASADVVFGHTISGRNGAIAGVGTMMGPCLNLVPVRVRFASPDSDSPSVNDDHSDGQAKPLDSNDNDTQREGMTARSLLHQIQSQLLSNMPHEVLGFRDIIRHCTPWPSWTYFSSTVQHQNVETKMALRFGGVDYAVGCEGAGLGDFSDLSVFSQGTGEQEHEYEMVLSFAEEGPIPREFAERALDMLCESAEGFARDPDVVLKSGEELEAGRAVLPFGETEVPVVASPAKKRELTAVEERGVLARVKTAWVRALGLENAGEEITAETSFFALGGDMTTLGQVAWLLGEGQTARPALEDLADHPTLGGHVAIMAALMPERAMVRVPETKSDVVSAVKTAKVSTLARAAKMIRSWGRKRVEVVV